MDHNPFGIFHTCVVPAYTESITMTKKAYLAGGCFWGE